MVQFTSFVMFFLLTLAVFAPYPSAAMNRLGAADDGPKTAREPKPSLDEAYRQWHKGFSSDKKEEHLKVLRSMLPTKKDLVILFPKQADKFWPAVEKDNQFMVENVAKLAKEVTRAGPVKKVEIIDVRKDKDKSSGSYKRVLGMIPKEVPVLDVVIVQQEGMGGGGSYLYLNGRWVWFSQFYAYPELLDEIK